MNSEQKQKCVAMTKELSNLLIDIDYHLLTDKDCQDLLARLINTADNLRIYVEIYNK